MDPAAESLFHELADIAPADREQIFQQRHVPSAVRAEVEALLRFDVASGAPLTACVAASAERVLQTSAGMDLNRRCGPYRLLRVLGRGGMGSVYLGERTDGEVEQRVAIKFLRYGGDEPAFLVRFLRERQILAALSHPGIAHLLDAGHTGDGLPYLAMEYVEGLPIDAYAHGLSVAEKLGLFLRVCEAVAYSHRNLIIHRDLKPSNILVDPSGQPKLLDFGIAKILDAAVDQTRTQERLLTPEYASPEQIRGGPQATTSDVYSLGAVLYKLLTGCSPHGFASDSRAALQDAICTVDPAAPSRVRPALPRDLDFVVGKALRKEPDQRYSSADALADDVRAFLQSRPVRARAGDSWYRARKFLRRSWLPVASASLIIASLMAGLLVANHERAVAERRFQQVRRLANQVLALDDVIRVLPGSTKARQEIVAISRNYLEGLGADTPSDPELSFEVASAYTALARAQGVPTVANLGQYAAAEVSLAKADALLEAILQASPHHRQALLKSAAVAHDRMILASTDHRREEALAQARKAARRIDALTALGQPTPEELKEASRLLANIALAHKNMHLYDASIAYGRRAIELSRSLPEGPGVKSQALSVMADSMRYSGNLGGALQAIREARSNIEHATFSGETVRRSSFFNLLWREGVILGQDGEISLNRPAEAAAVLQQAFDSAEQWARQDPDDAVSRILAGSAARELGKILEHSDPRRALQIYDKALFRLSEIKNNTDARRQEVRLQAGASYALRRMHHPADAKNRIDTAFQLLRAAKRYPADRINPDDEAEPALRALADHLAETGQPGRAADVYQELLAKILASHPDPGNDLRHATELSRLYQALAVLHRRTGHLDQAARLEATRQDLWRPWQARLPGNPFVLRQIASASVK